MTTKKLLEPADMEARLASAFRPVQPSRKFVQTVRGRIVHLSPSVVIADPLRDSSRAVIVISSVISGAILLAAVARVMFYVINKFSLPKN